MHRDPIRVLMLLFIALSLVATGAFAAKEVKDVITFNTPAYDKHQEAPVVFSHKRHSSDYFDEYPELYESPCGECHHDKDSNKLVDLKEGDEVQSCIECHKKPGYMKGKEARGLSKQQKREYHANALHDNCKDCHKAYNKARQLKPGSRGICTSNLCNLQR